MIEDVSRLFHISWLTFVEHIIEVAVQMDETVIVDVDDEDLIMPDIHRPFSH